MLSPGRVYPRVCGGISFLSCASNRARGLSPRVRGHPATARPMAFSQGSIPACAGASGVRLRKEKPHGVYPRVCGGIFRAVYTASNHTGLSPRVRGHHLLEAAGILKKRSIPACAGASDAGLDLQGVLEVYPRVCGGIIVRCPHFYRRIGLSPRVRGHPRRRTTTRRSGGSIPACAGASTGGATCRRPGGVYPRVCGGISLKEQSPAIKQGLSPRVRGHRDGALAGVAVVGSIPACAGAS